MRTFVTALLLLMVFSLPVLAGDKDVSGTTITLLAPTGPIVGDSAILEFAIFNNSGDSERHTSTAITLPECVVIYALGYYFEFADYDYTTTGIGTNEALIYSTWGNGLLAGGETMMFYVTVNFEDCGNLDLCYDWDFVGDFDGGDPHFLMGTECTSVVANDASSWGSVKSLYR